MDLHGKNCRKLIVKCYYGIVYRFLLLYSQQQDIHTDIASYSFIISCVVSGEFILRSTSIAPPCLQRKQIATQTIFDVLLHRIQHKTFSYICIAIWKYINGITDYAFDIKVKQSLVSAWGAVPPRHAHCFILVQSCP